MKRLWKYFAGSENDGKRVLFILLFHCLIYASFNKIQCDKCFEYDRFLFSDWTCTNPIYAWNICLNIILISGCWTAASVVINLRKYVVIASCIISGRLLDFIFHANQSYGHMGVYAISYDTIMFVLLGLVVLKAMLNE